MSNKNKSLDFRKNIFIIGNSEFDRSQCLNAILLRSNLEIFRFPRGMKSFTEYVETVQHKNLFSSYYEEKGKYTLDQIFDFHIDWLQKNRVIIIFEDFQEMDDKWQLELLRIIFNNLEVSKNSARVILTLNEDNGIIMKLCEAVYATEYKSKRQIVESNLLVIEI